MSSKPRVNEAQVKQIQSLLKKNVSKSEVARQLKKSRPWLDRVIETFGREAVSEKSKLVTPKYIEEFEASDTVQAMREAYKGRSMLEGIIRVGRESWRALGKKDPLSWTEEDFLALLKHPAFIDPQTGKIQFNNMTFLRAWMNHIKRFDLLQRPEFNTKGLKRPKGRRKAHYLKSEDEIIRVIQYVERPDTLLFIRAGIESGGRYSSSTLIRPQDIDQTQNIIYMYEPKVKQYVERLFAKETIQALRQFIIDYNLKPDERLFKRAMYLYNKEMREAGDKAQLGFPFTTHTLKHTFVSLASAHGVSLEIVSDQTGTDAQTLREFYLAINPAKKRHELLGEPLEYKTWGQLIKELDPYYRQRYSEIKGNYVKVNGIQKSTTQAPKPKAEKPKKARPINWKAVDGIIASPKTKPALIPLWKKAKELHDKGFSDFEVRQKMGWRQRT